MDFDWFNFEFLRNSMIQWAIFVALFLCISFSLILVRRILIRRLKVYAARTKTEWDDFFLALLRITRRFFIFSTALFLASLVLDRSLRVAHISRSLYVLILLIQTGFWGMHLIEFVIHRMVHRRAKENGGVDSALATTLPTIRFFASIFLFSFLGLLALDNLGINVTALLAGLGVGGIAVALAAQNILGDIFASLSIVIDKPFVIDDLITVGTFQGTVEKIGLKTTRLRSITGEQLIISNADLLQSRIQNFKRMDERRITFVLNITYDTPAERLQKIPTIIKEIIDAQSDIRFERAHFKAFAPSSLDFEVVYWIESPDARLSMDLQQIVNFKILKAFALEKIQFAYPTQTLFVHSAQAKEVSA